MPQTTDTNEKVKSRYRAMFSRDRRLCDVQKSIGINLITVTVSQ
jgi:hypothetical protein